MLKFERNQPLILDINGIYVVENGEVIEERLLPQPPNFVIHTKSFRERDVEFLGKLFTILYFGDSLSALFCEDWRIETQGAGMFYDARAIHDWQTGEVIHGGGARWYFSGDFQKFQDDLCLMTCFGTQPDINEFL